MSSQKLTVLKTQIKVISNPYESPYEIYQVLSIRRRCLRAITKAPFKQTDVFTLYVSCFCVRFTAVPTAKQNTTPVIHVNWERHQTSSKSTLARGPRRPDLHWCLWLSSSLEFDRRSLILNCLIVFACVQIVANKCFHSHPLLPLSSFQSLPQAGRAELLFLSDTLLHIRSSTHSQPPSANAEPQFGVEIEALGHLCGMFSPVVRPLCYRSMSFLHGFHADITSSSVSAETSQSWTVFITVEQAKPKRISWYYLKFCLCFLSHGSQNKSANQSLSDDSKYDWITDLLILWCLVFPNFELFLFYS